MPVVTIGYLQPELAYGNRLPARYAAVGYEQITYVEDTGLLVGQLQMVANNIIAALNDFHGGGFSIDLSGRKRVALEKMERRTLELVALGYTYNSKVYSLQQEALNRYMIINHLAVGALLSTIIFETQDATESITFNLLSLGGAQSFAKGALAAYHNIMNAGYTAKDAVRACTTEAQLAALVDNR